MSTCSLDLPSLTNVTIGEQSLKGIEKGQSSLSIVGMNRILLLVIDCPQLSFFSGMLLVHGESFGSKSSSIYRSFID